MPSTHDEVLEVVGQWVDKAEHDFISARHLLTLKRHCPTDVVCFHVQQCIEKYLKALLIFHDVDFGRTHHISALIRLLPGNTELNLTVEEQERLTDYAVTARYPGDYDPISLAEAYEAVNLARRVRREARRVLRQS